MRLSPLLSATLIAGFVAACSSSEGPSNPATPSRADDHWGSRNSKHRRPNGALISHVFIVVQENRTVDNLFNGLPGANTVTSGMSGDQIVQLKPVPIATPQDYSHKLSAFLTDTACPQTRYEPPCPMNGFKPPSGGSPGAYVYVDPSYTKPYFAMAEQYAFGDNTFTSNVDASFVSHQYLVAAQANSAVDFPNSRTGCPPSQSPLVATITSDRNYGPTEESACFIYDTIVDELYSDKLPWRYYEAAANVSGLAWWDPFLWIPHDQSAPGGAIINGPSQFITDIKSQNPPYDAAVTWIMPTFKNSDHSGGTTNLGPNWVAAVVNAIGTSPLWDSSVIFITWDDWGGWYDHVTPPYEDYDGLGIRVPFIIISPYTKRGLVTHTQYEQASILKYVEVLFGLSPLTAADQRAINPSPDVMSNGIVPRPFATISAGPYSSPDDLGPPDTDQ